MFIKRAILHGENTRCNTLNIVYNTYTRISDVYQETQVAPRESHNMAPTLEGIYKWKMEYIVAVIYIHKCM